MALIYAASPGLVSTVRFREILPSSSSCLSLKQLQSATTYSASRRWLGVACRTRMGALGSVAAPENATIMEEEEEKEETDEEEEEEEAEAEGESEEEDVDESRLVEIGYVMRPMGLRGDLLVKPYRLAAEAGFAEPGPMWMKITRRGKHRIECTKLVSARVKPARVPYWLMTFENITSKDEALHYLGASLMVKDEEEEEPLSGWGACSSSDLRGLDIILQSTGESIGTVVDVVSAFGHNTLHVERNPGSSIGPGPLLLLPFTKRIVPVLDIENGRAIANPPEFMFKLHTKKSVEKAEDLEKKKALREARKFKRKVTGLKKSLGKVNELHLVKGIQEAEEEQRNMYLQHLLKFDFKALHERLKKAQERQTCSLSGFTGNPAELKSVEPWLDSTRPRDIQDKDQDGKWWTQGLELIATNKVAVASLVSSKSQDWKCCIQLHAERLSEVQKLARLEFPNAACRVIWFLCTSSGMVEQVQSLLKEEKFFGFGEAQVHVLEVESYPCFDAAAHGDGNHRILRSSPCELAQSVTGEGGVLKALLSGDTITKIDKKGLEYVQVLDGDNMKVMIADPTFLGYAGAQQSDLSFQVREADEVFAEEGSLVSFIKEDGQQNYTLFHAYSWETGGWSMTANTAIPIGNFVLSTRLLKRLKGSEFELELHTRRTRIQCHEEDETEDVSAGKPNGLVLQYSLLDCMVQCKPSKVSLLQVKSEQ